MGQGATSHECRFTSKSITPMAEYILKLPALDPSKRAGIGVVKSEARWGRGAARKKQGVHVERP